MGKPVGSLHLARALTRFRAPAPVAQLDRAPDYESGGLGFESLPVRHLGQDRVAIGRHQPSSGRAREKSPWMTATLPLFPQHRVVKSPAESGLPRDARAGEGYRGAGASPACGAEIHDMTRTRAAGLRILCARPLAATCGREPFGLRRDRRIAVRPHRSGSPALRQCSGATCAGRSRARTSASCAASGPAGGITTATAGAHGCAASGSRRHGPDGAARSRRRVRADQRGARRQHRHGRQPHRRHAARAQLEGLQIEARQQRAAFHRSARSSGAQAAASCRGCGGGAFPRGSPEERRAAIPN